MLTKIQKLIFDYIVKNSTNNLCHKTNQEFVNAIKCHGVILERNYISTALKSLAKKELIAIETTYCDNRQGRKHVITIKKTDPFFNSKSTKNAI